MENGICKGAKSRLAHSSFLDTGFLTGEITQVEDTSATYSAVLVDINLLDEGAGDGEDTLYANAIGNLTNSKGFGGTRTTTLDNNALEVLDTLFVSFTDFIVNSNGIASAEFGEFFAFDLVFYELN